MATDAPMVTATSAQILTLSQWLSPAYPVGAFAYSHGLEAAADQGWLRDGSDLEAWLQEVLEHGAGRSDALFLAAAWHANAAADLVADLVADLAAIDATACAFAASQERLLETRQQGRSFGLVTEAIWGAQLAGLTYPVALGAAAAAEGLPLELTQVMYLQVFCPTWSQRASGCCRWARPRGSRSCSGSAAACPPLRTRPAMAI